METTIRLHSLPLTQSKTYLVAGLLVSGNVLLPAICHIIPQGGLMFLPIYFFTVFGAYKYGWKAGLLIGVLSPLINHLATGMPPAPALPAILAKSALIVLAASYAAKRFRKVSIPILVGVILSYQLAGTAFEWAYTGSLYAALQDFRLAIPGMLLQVFGVYGLIKLISRYENRDGDQEN